MKKYYKVNDDGITCSVNNRPPAEGFIPLPLWVDGNKSVYWDGEKPTNEKPVAMKNEEHQQKFYAAYKQYIESKISPDTQRRLQSLHASPKTNANQKAALEAGEDWIDAVEAHYIDNADTPFFEWDFTQFDAACPFSENKYHKIIKAIKAIK